MVPIPLRLAFSIHTNWLWSFMAKITDAAVKARTGKDWQTWFRILDEAGAREMNHKEIVALLARDHQIGPWWQQSVTVEYERSRGLREKHETPEGYQIGASKTLSVPLEVAYEAWVNDRERMDWLPNDRLIITTKTRGKSIRGSWAGGPSRLDVYFYPKGDRRTQISVDHSKLDDAEAAEEMKSFWRDALGRLQAYLTGD